ncbi:hypothetical protein M5K25_012749 [Dendrobium thyrsiflorum]|uniref:Uncharacterized protein n=1 Tax=Dendrobium thyrsiflorum TaxID=117978 RepID=A0ABD0UYB5_DENTH
MSQIKATMEDRLSSVEGKISSIEKVSDLHLMMKKIFENQIQVAASEAKGPVRTTNSDVRRKESNGESIEERGGRYRERRGYREQGVKGAVWERKEGNYVRRGANFGGRREESEEGLQIANTWNQIIKSLQNEANFQEITCDFHAALAASIGVPTVGRFHVGFLFAMLLYYSPFLELLILLMNSAGSKQRSCVSLKILEELSLSTSMKVAS